jgi:hypothetical protein
MITRRSEEGALKCAARDLRLEEWTTVEEIVRMAGRIKSVGAIASREKTYAC